MGTQKKKHNRTYETRNYRNSKAAAAEAEQKARLNEMRLAALYQLIHMDDAPEESVMRFVVESITKLTDSTLGYLYISSEAPGKKGRMIWSQAHYDFLNADDLPEDRPPFSEISTWQNEPDIRMINNGDDIHHPTHTVFGGKLQVTRYMKAPVMEGTRPVCIASVCNKVKEYEETDLQQLELFLKGVWLIIRRHNFVRRLKKTKEISDRANRVKDEFLANISHELRTPLNGMLSMIELLRLSPLSAEQQEYVHAAGHSGEALLRIISDILDFSRMASGKMELRIAPFFIADTVRSSLDLFILEAAQKGLTLDCQIADNLPRGLLGDEARVRQIMYNLVGNALKFTDQGGITVHCCMLPHTHKGKTWIYLAVEDTGIGISDAEMGAVFDPFTQLPNAFARKYPGTGLGLGIVKNLVELMESSLTFESEEGKGTTAHCVLGFTRAAAQYSHPKARNAMVPGQPHPVLDVLVAEDDAVSRLALRSLLRRFGHRAACVKNGRQALEALLLHPFHCLITDIQMPEMSGVELVQRIRADKINDITPGKEVYALLEETLPEVGTARYPIPVDFPVAALTAHAMLGDKEYFLSQGFDMYLSKPVVTRELLLVLQEMSGGI